MKLRMGKDSNHKMINNHLWITLITLLILLILLVYSYSYRVVSKLESHNRYLEDIVGDVNEIPLLMNLDEDDDDEFMKKQRRDAENKRIQGIVATRMKLRRAIELDSADTNDAVSVKQKPDASIIPNGLFVKGSIEERMTMKMYQEFPFKLKRNESDVNGIYGMSKFKYHPYFDRSDPGKDIVLMFEKPEDIMLIWAGEDYRTMVKTYMWKDIPCHNYGVRSCSVTVDTKNLAIADAVIHLAPFDAKRALTLPLRNDQAYIGFFTEADDSGCQKKSFDAKLSYSSDANIMFNDNCLAVKIMFRCMVFAKNIVSRQEMLGRSEKLRMQRQIYQYCTVHPGLDESTLEKDGKGFVRESSGDVVIFVSNCAKPRQLFIKALIDASPSKMIVHSSGKCFQNFHTDENKIDSSRRYKFLFAAENKIRMNYVTEKIFQGFRAGTVPIYQGAPNIFQYAPRGSFVGLNTFATPAELVTYLEYLTKNETAYNEFFDWDLGEWLKVPHTFQCLRVEAEFAFDSGFCSLCDWMANIFPKWKQEGRKNCDPYDYAPYVGYPKNPTDISTHLV